MELDWSHSFAMQFNVFKHSINLVHRNNFGIVWGAGFEYQRLRFENNYSSVTWADHQLIPIDLHENDKIASVKRSSFKTFYLDRKSTRLNSSHMPKSRMPSSA